MVRVIELELWVTGRQFEQGDINDRKSNGYHPGGRIPQYRLEPAKAVINSQGGAHHQ